MLKILKMSLMNALSLCITVVSAQSHQYYQDLMAQYHKDNSFAHKEINIEMINGGEWSTNYHGFVHGNGAVGDFMIYINAQLLFYSDDNPGTDEYWAKLNVMEGPYTGIKHSSFDPGDTMRNLIQELMDMYFPNGDTQELTFMNQKAHFAMLYTWDTKAVYAKLQCRKLNKEKVELEKETLICIEESSIGQFYTEYWILEREILS
ncbi:hypothetical protein MRY82_07390 [bacterium]|nr:hypothetical protein [bacterium]